MVVGAMPLLVLMAFAPMEMEVLGAGEFNPFFSTADVSRIFPGSGMVRLNVSILIASLCPGICLVGECGFIQDCHHHNPVIRPEKIVFMALELVSQFIVHSLTRNFLSTSVGIVTRYV